VGTDKTGAKGLPNGDLPCVAVLITGNSSGNKVGGTTAGARNIVSGNADDGIDILGSLQNKVLGNRIGTTAGGAGALPNALDGVFVQGSSNLIGDGTVAGSNTIAFNKDDGLEVLGSAASGNAISRNSVFSNGGIGIDLKGGFEDAAGNTVNDPGDVDEGPNGLQNKPVVSSVRTVSGKTTVKGTLGSAPERGYVIQFYSNPSGDEGKKFLGQKSVVPDFNGDAFFAFSPATKVPVGQTVTATATRVREGTSEFSAPKKVTS